MHSSAVYFAAFSGLPDTQGMQTLASRVFHQVFRTDFQAPGIALVNLGQTVGSRQLRSFMVALKELLAERFYHQTGKRLDYLSLGRFDQQDTTKFHLDGAPEESFLMLGYEPTKVRSEVAIADYSKAAFDLGMEPKQFLAELNPMYAAGMERLAPYVTRLTAFDPGAAQVLLINNSSQPFIPNEQNQLGVLHQATILQPLPTERRVVNSTMLFTSTDASIIPASTRTVEEFQMTETIAVKGYG
jgi:hypothetical protein